MCTKFEKNLYISFRDKSKVVLNRMYKVVDKLFVLSIEEKYIENRNFYRVVLLPLNVPK